MPLQNLQCTQMMARVLGLPQKLERLHEVLSGQKLKGWHSADIDALRTGEAYQLMLKSQK